MWKMSIASMLKVTLVAALSLPTLLAVPTAGVVIASPSITSGALTPPPPSEPSMHARVALNHIFQAVGTITPGDGLSANVSTTTTTFSEVKSLKVDYRLERWTGTDWVFYRSNTKKKTQTQSLNAQSSWTVLTGYYYRVVSSHTANDGTQQETTTHTSNTILF